ncbi:MAG: response regulator [Candidatus Omnitrophica bacterium]|nr:response regulator [Candidatus Omnitrophota bacterium]
MNFPDNLKKVRREKSLSQQQLADKLGVAQSTIGMWEAGARTPKLEELNRLATALKITIGRLIGQKHIEITKGSIRIDGKKIDIGELDPTDVDGIIEYIQYIKNKKGTLPKSPPPNMNVNAKKVLIIDDEQEICEMLYSFLVPHNYKVFLAFNGQMGLEYFEEIKPDIVLLDLKMPDIDGVEVLKIIRKVSDTPVVIITGHPEEVSEIHLTGLKIEGYIEKPISLKAVLNSLKHIVGE